MKYVFLCIVIVLIGCSEHEADQKKEMIPDPSATMTFEGQVFVKVDLSTYHHDGDDYQTIITLFPNGQVKCVEHQGEFQSCGALVDTSRYFNESGTLIKQIYHDHWMPEGAGGCHESVEDSYVTEFFDKGSIKAKKLFRTGYQGVEEKAGVWQEFDKYGVVVSTINYGDPSSIEDLLSVDFIEKLESGLGDLYSISLLSNKGFNRVFGANSVEGEFEFYNKKTGNRIEMSKTIYPDGETSFGVGYYVNRNQLIAFEDLLKETTGPYTYHGSSTDKYTKGGLGTYRSKIITIDLEANKIIYSHSVGKELSSAPIEFDPPVIRNL